jgi:hypothetical protein
VNNSAVTSTIDYQLKNLLSATNVHSTTVTATTVSAATFSGGSVTGLPGLLADDQHVLDSEVIPAIGAIDVRNFASINAACADASTLNKTIFVPNNQTLTANLTVENRTIMILPETGSITKASTFTLTFGTGSHFVNLDPLHYCFIGFSIGNVTFGSVEKVYPEWWGAIGDGTTNSTTAILCAMSSLPTGGTIYFMPGTFLITDLAWPTTKTYRWIGSGSYKTIFKPYGTPTNYMVYVYNQDYNSEISQIGFDGNNVNTLGLKVENASLFIMKDVIFSYFNWTALYLKAVWDSDFYNIFVEECGSGTNHPSVVLQSDTSLSFNRNNFYNLHIENWVNNCRFLSIEGTSTAPTDHNTFYSLKCHGSPNSKGTNNPTVPLVYGNSYAHNLMFYSPQIAFGRGTSQMEFNGRFINIYSPEFGTGDIARPEVAVDIKGEYSTIFVPYLFPDAYTVAGVRFDGASDTVRNANIIFPFCSDATNPLYTNINNAWGNVIRYNPTNAYGMTLESQRGVGLKNVLGLTGGSVLPNNLRGYTTFANSGIVSVTFPTSESDANYFIWVTGNQNETFYVTDRATTGFNIHSSNATSTALVFWLLVR